MATNYGDLYNQATAQWDALGQDGQLRSLGFTPNYKEQGAGFAYDIPQQYYGNFNTGGDGSNDAALAAGIAKSTEFDKQKWLNDQGIVQYFDGAPGSGVTPEQQQAYRDNWARSFNQFGFNFGGMDDYLLHQTGPGHFEQDPTLGKLWVPDNKNSQTWNNGAMAASGAPQGGAIAKAVGNFANSGGIVKAIGGAIGGAGLSDLWGGFTGAPMSDLPTGMDIAGDSIAQSTPLTESAWGVNPRLDALANPYTSPEIPEMYQNVGPNPVAGSSPTGGFNMDYFKNTPTTTLVQQLMSAGKSAAEATTLAQALTSGASMGGVPWTQLAQGAASLLGGAIGSNAAGNAANAQVAGTEAATAEQRRQFDTTQANNAPFLATGTAANGRLKQLLGLDSGYTASDSGSLVKKFSSSDLNADPVYQSGLQFGLDEGTKGINARAIAGGGYDSGATLKALTQFGNDYGSTKANDSFNRYNTENTGIYNKLAGVSGAGQTAVNTVANAGTNATNAISGDLTSAGNSRAASIVGGAQAWGGALGGVGDALQSYQNSQNGSQTLQALMRRNGTSLYGY